VVTNGSEQAIDPGLAPAPDGVRCIHVAGRSANLARNAGLEAAQGDYVRFLDDDDFLDPGAALAQYMAMDATDADVSTGAVRFIDENGHETGSYAPRETADLAAELLWQRPSTLPVAHLFRRSFLAGLSWDPTRGYLQDVDWMHGMLRRGEVRWHAFPDTVGTWYQHAGVRTSVHGAKALAEEALRQGASIISETIGALAAQGRLTACRRHAGAKALWDYTHQGFSYSPWFWQELARQARSLDPDSRPGSRLFARWPISRLNPIVAEWLLYPARALVRKVGK
jgi:glycosyltransferase involved in cell wall biosynthesis